MNKGNFLIILYTLLLIITIIKFNSYINKLDLNDYNYVNEEIINKTNYKDELLILKNVAAVKKNVYIYKNISGKKDWYLDKTSESGYNNTYFVLDNIKTLNYSLNKKYFENKVKFKQVKFKNSSIFYGNEIKNYKYFDDESNYTDLDSYISNTNKKIAKIKRDKFIVIDDYKLYKGSNYYNPKIGDVLITYYTFSPNNLYFFGNFKNLKQNNYKVIFDVNNNFFITIFLKSKVIIIIFLFINVILFFIILLLKKLYQLKNFTLNFIPFFNEYFAYSDKFYFNSVILLIMIGFICLDKYYFAVIAFIPLLIEREIDYYSI